MKPSEIFEGENSSLKKTFDNAVKSGVPKLKEEILKEFDKVFSIKDNVWGKAKYDGGNTIYQPSKVKQFISSSLDKQHKADMEEVVEKIENYCADGFTDNDESLILKKELINTLKEKV